MSEYSTRRILDFKTKAPSLESLYECVYMNVFDVDANVNEVAAVDPQLRKLIQDTDILSPDPNVPLFLIVNAQVPSIVGPLRRGNVPPDGPGFFFFFFFFAAKLSERTRNELFQLESDQDEKNPRLTAVRLLRDYCCNALSETQTQKGRFKVICASRNLEKVPKFARTL